MPHKPKAKLNCWEFIQCGREKDGAKAGELGICPANTTEILHAVHDGQNCGRACWVMEGTLCSATVQGPFQDKFKKCIRCAFFHYVEAQEGKNLKNVNKLLQLVQLDNGTATAEKINKCQPIAVCKKCAQELRLSMDPNWNINIIGTIELQCRNCGQILRTKGLLSEEPAEGISLNL